MESPVTTCISSHNNLNYVKLAYESVRKNAYYKDQPIVIHAENCDDGTDEWLTELDDKNVQVFIEKNEVPRGIGGGMDFCVSKVTTKYVNIIHADMWIAPNQDIELQKIIEEGVGAGASANADASGTAGGVAGVTATGVARRVAGAPAGAVAIAHAGANAGAGAGAVAGASARSKFQTLEKNHIKYVPPEAAIWFLY